MNKLFQVMNGHSMLGLEFQLVDVDVYLLLRSLLAVLVQEACVIRKGPWIAGARSGHMQQKRKTEKQPFELSELSPLILESEKGTTKRV